jgi:chain length determinant protein EpsF
MKIPRFLQVLRARRKVILLTLLVTTLTAFAVSLLQPKVYTSTASLVISYRGADSAVGAALPAQVIQGYIATQVDIIGSRNVALKVVDMLKLDQSGEVREQFRESGGDGSIRDWLADQLLNNLEVRPSRESSVIDVTFKATDPKFAASVANGFAAAYQGAGVQLTAEPMKKASGIFADQVKQLRRNLEEAQKKLSKFQQDKGIVSADSRMDVETSRLNELSSQLVAVQAQVVEAASRRSGGPGSASESPEVLGNPLIQNLKAELARAEAKFSQSTQGLGPNHPTYRAAQAEVSRLRAELNAQTTAISHGAASNLRSLQQREADLRSAYNQQKARVLEMNQARDQLGLMARETENAQRAYDTAAQRLSKTSIEGQIGQADVALLNEAVPALSPSGPQVWRNTSIAALLGGLLGLVIGLLAEMADRRVRTADDLADVLDAPVLGVIGWERETEDRFSAPRLGMQRPLLPY